MDGAVDGAVDGAAHHVSVRTSFEKMAQQPITKSTVGNTQRTQGNPLAAALSLAAWRRFRAALATMAVRPGQQARQRVAGTTGATGATTRLGHAATHR